MNKVLIVIAALTALLLQFNCDQNVESPEFIGSWNYSMQALPPILKFSLNLDLTVNNDNTYELTVLQDTIKKVFSSTGTWTETGDSVILKGDDCFMLDTTANPDTLAPMKATDCSTPISLVIPDKNDDIWPIKTASLQAPLSVLLEPAMLTAVINAFQMLNLTKTEE
jgi:hypothetical protein